LFHFYSVYFCFFIFLLSSFILSSSHFIPIFILLSFNFYFIHFLLAPFRAFFFLFLFFLLHSSNTSVFIFYLTR
jgi:hypothetical protein